MSDETDWTPLGQTQWPNRTPIVDGVIPVSEMSQDPYFNVDTEDQLQKVFGV